LIDQLIIYCLHPLLSNFISEQLDIPICQIALGGLCNYDIGYSSRKIEYFLTFQNKPASRQERATKLEWWRLC